MSPLLDRAVSEIEKLPVEEQDAFADLILAELEDEALWAEQFANSQPQLAKLAERVRDDIRSGRVRQAGIDEL